jgi:hypothetical protein
MDVAGGVAVEFGQPPFAPDCRRRAVLATAMPMPETAVNEDGGFVFGKKDVGRDETRSAECGTRNQVGKRSSRFLALHSAFRVPRWNGNPDVETKTIAEPVQQ